jgi:FMN reductase (NADPH)/FMN reductase [NAD(P)H]
MNETLQVIANRRSVRNYADTPLTAEEKNAILTSAMRAPTAGNLMLYSIIEIEDQALKDRLAITCDNQPFIAKAPFLLLFAADYQRMYDQFVMSGAEQKCLERGINPRPPQEGDMLLACCDALIAAQNAVIAAESLGIGSCYIGDILEQYEIHRELLDLPQYVLPLALVCFGRPAVVKEEKRLTPRYDSRFVVFKDRYHRLTRQEVQEMLRPTVEKAFPGEFHAEDVDELIQRVYFRKFVSDFSVEMTRSVRAMLKNWQQ